MKSRLMAWLLAAYLCWPGQATAADTGVVSRHWKEQNVFFATDRELRTTNRLKFGGQLNEPIDHVVYGLVACDNCGDHAANRTYSSFREFSEELHKAVAISGKNGLVVYVHGCCVTFREAVKQAAKLQAEVGMPVVTYDWGTPAFGYSGSLLAGPRSQERFNDLMLKVAREFPHERIALVGLSLGGVLIDNFLVQHRPSEVGRQFDQVVFARADMDSIAFRTHIPKISEHTSKLFVFAGNNDPAINASHILRCIATPTFRGDRVGRLSERLPKERPVQVIDVSPLHMNHTLPYAVVADLLTSNDGHPPQGQYHYIELPDGIWRAEPRERLDLERPRSRQAVDQ